MPQLTGPEQLILVKLVVDHLNEPEQLDRALLFAGLGNLSRYSSKGTLDAMTSDVVRVLSARYQIPEFVDAVLNGDFLNGHCPPIEDWLLKHRDELLRRRNNPTPVEKFASVAQSWKVLLLLLAIVLMAAYVGVYILNHSQAPEIELAGQSFSLQQSVAALASIANARPTRGSEELQAYTSELVDKGEYGVVLIAKPLELKKTNPTITVKGIEQDASYLDDRDGTVEICCLPPDRNRESQARWSPRLKLNDGVAMDRYNGELTAGTQVVVVYHRQEPRSTQPKFTVSLK